MRIQERGIRSGNTSGTPRVGTLASFAADPEKPRTRTTCGLSDGYFFEQKAADKMV